MEERDYDELKKHWDEQTALIEWKQASYEAQLQAVEDELDTYEIDCAVFKSKRCLEAFDQIQVTRRRFTRAREIFFGQCKYECEDVRPPRWMLLEFEDLPLRNEVEKGIYSAYRSCWHVCSRAHLRSLRTQLQALTRAKLQVQRDFLQTDQDPLRIDKRPSDRFY